jgi:hypothetical protein
MRDGMTAGTWPCARFIDPRALLLPGLPFLGPAGIE